MIPTLVENSKFFRVLVLLYLMLYKILYALVLFRKGDFHHVKCACRTILKAGF